MRYENIRRKELAARKTIVLVLLALLVTMLLAAPVRAAEIEVPCVEDASQALSAAIQSANDAPGHDIIRLAGECTYRLTTVQAVDEGYNGLPVITEALTIEGQGASIRRGPGAQDDFRLMITADQVPLSINDLLLGSGYAASPDGEPANGGAVYARGSLVLDNVYFSYNQATGYGGAVYAYPPLDSSGLLSISNSFFEESYADLSGGALFTSAHLVVNSSTFTDNGSRTESGGAISIFYANQTAVIQNSHFESNAAQEGAGGAINVRQGGLTVIATDFLYNTAKNGGGLGFYAHVLFGTTSQPLTISDAYFLRNAAELRGGAIHAYGSDLLLERSRFVQNQGNEGASTLYVAPYEDGHSRIANNLWVRDRSEQAVATIYVKQRDPSSGVQNILHNTLVSPQESVYTAIRVEQAAAVNVVNNIFSGFDTAVRVDTSGVSSGFNLYHITEPSPTGPEVGPIVPYAGGNNLVDDPLFVDPAADDYRLQGNSPAVDSGVDVGVSIDMLGLSRPQGITYDRGAYEYIQLNTAPVATNDTYDTEEGNSLTVSAPGVLANDNDPEDDALTAQLLSEPEHGSLSFNTDGSFTYIPDSGYAGEDSFDYRAYDGQVKSNTALVTIEVQKVNNAPTAVDDSYGTLQDTALVIAAPGVLDNDEDADGDALTAALVSGPDHGDMTLNANGSFSYTPDSGYWGPDSFTYRASDGEDESNTALVTIEVQKVNNDPTAVDDGYVALQDAELVIAAPGVLDNDTDDDGDTLTAALESAPDHGDVTLNADGSFSYMPDGGHSGEDSFTYRASDGEDSSNVATVTITTEEVDANVPPVAVRDSYATDEDSPLTVPAPGVLSNDSDANGDSLTAVLESQPAHGEVTLNANGGFSYTPDSGYYGEDGFAYRARDGQDGSNVATATIDVQHVNEPPVAVDDAYGTLQDTVLTVAAPGVLDNDQDAEGDTLTAGLVSSPSHGQVALNADGSFSYTPDSGYTGPDTFTYRAHDGQEGSNEATVTITVEEVNVNVPPTAVGDSYETEVDTALTVAAPGVLGNDGDANGDALTVVLVSGPAHGQLTQEDDGSFSYTPDNGYSGDDSFTYRASDGVNTSNEVAVRIAVLADEEAPFTIFVPMILK